MEAQPLSKDIYNKAKKLGVEKITLNFSGGSDEGNLYVETEPKYNSEFAQEVEDWAWEVYSYSGAGDGTDYGDTIIYDLKEGKVSTSEWFHVIKEEDGGTTKLEIEED
jgi:hypothetical protein